MGLRDALRRWFGRPEAQAETPLMAPQEDAPEAQPLVPETDAATPEAETQHEQPAAPAASSEEPAATPAEPGEPAPAARLHDLRELESRAILVRGAEEHVGAADGAALGASELVLVLEPEESEAGSPIAVHAAGRKLGHVPAATAGQLVPLLSRLPHDAFLVGGVVEQQSGRAAQLRVLIPRVPALRAHVHSLGH